MSTLIDPDLVDAAFRDCLSDLDTGFDVEGLVHAAWFTHEALERHREDIEAWLMALPPQFRQSDPAKGWSFLQACVDSEGRQWGEHVNVEQLLMLGLGLGLVQFIVPREMWAQLPGGVPYFSIRDDLITKPEPVAPT